MKYEDERKESDTTQEDLWLVRWRQDGYSLYAKLWLKVTPLTRDALLDFNAPTRTSRVTPRHHSSTMARKRTTMREKEEKQAREDPFINDEGEDIEDEDAPPYIEPYEVLGLEKEATADDVKKAYRKMALKHHPGMRHPY